MEKIKQNPISKEPPTAKNPNNNIKSSGFKDGGEGRGGRQDKYLDNNLNNTNTKINNNLSNVNDNTKIVKNSTMFSVGAGNENKIPVKKEKTTSCRCIIF